MPLISFHLHYLGFATKFNLFFAQKFGSCFLERNISDKIKPCVARQNTDNIGWAFHKTPRSLALSISLCNTFVDVYGKITWKTEAMESFDMDSSIHLGFHYLSSG